jgi:hypothetical protein
LQPVEVGLADVEIRVGCQVEPFAQGRIAPRRKAPKAPVLEVLEDRTLPSGTPIITLQLLPAAGQSTPAPVTLALDSFQLSFHHRIGPNSVASFDALDVTAPYTANSPLLFGQLTIGQAYPSAVLTQKDGSGNTVGIWALNDVHVTDDAVTGSGSGLPSEELKFAFAELGQGVGHNQQTGSGPRLPRTS